MKYIDSFLNKITMYRLVLYYLIGLIAVAVGLSALGVLSYNPVHLLFSALFLVFFSLFVNIIFAKVFNAPTNLESTYITALILALIIDPASSLKDFIFLGWAATLAISSKYILAIGKKHIFNPAAIAVVITALVLGQSASWWVGNGPMMLFVLIGGFLTVRKIQREDLLLSFLGSFLLLVSVLAILRGDNVVTILTQTFLNSSLLFFGFVMLTEPLTTPPTRKLRILYGVLTGILFLPQLHIGSLYSTPELALVAGNVFSYLVSPRDKLMLYLSEKIQLSSDTYDFIFKLQKKLSFVPGQYMEWTLEHAKTDARGNRRYFTLASSPTEDTIRLGIKFYDNSSSYKKALLELSSQTPIVANQIAGDFTLPRDLSRKYVFIAGGIGITPYRSIIKYLIDTGQKRDIVLLYSNKTKDEIVYKDVFDVAQRDLGIRTVYTLTDVEQLPADWSGQKGRLNDVMIRSVIPDWQDRYFYLSGPHAMVEAYDTVLRNMGVSPFKIKKDFFPGFV